MRPTKTGEEPNGHAADPDRGRWTGTRATIYDIAKLAEVDPSTVSRALNQPGRLNYRTEARVRAAAKQLQYSVNPVARALLTGRTQTLAVIVSDITNPVFFPVVRSAEHEASANGYTLVIAESEESSEREAAVIERLLPSIDGVLLATTRLRDEDIKSLAHRLPIVLLNRELEGVNSTAPDLAPGVIGAISHLAESGHTSLVYIAGPRASWMNSRRREVLAQVAKTHGIEFTEVSSVEPTIEGGYRAYEAALSSGATAFAAYNDLMAIGIMRAAKEAGVDIPGAFSLVGFDNIFGSDFTTPTLSTIELPLAQQGRMAVRQLLGLTLDDTTPQTVFIHRESSGRAATSD